MLQRLLSKGYVDFLALSPGAVSGIKEPPEELLIDSPSEIFRKNWEPKAIFIFIGSVGAAVRIIAPLLTTKDKDPAVLVLDSRAENILPLIGGHQVGAEQLALELSEDLGGKAVITGFSATQQKLAIDCFGHAWGWKRKGHLKKWNDLMMQQATLSPINFTQDCGSKLWQSSQGALNSSVANQNQDNLQSPSFVISSKRTENCSWHPPVLWVGVGCERNTSLSLLQEALGKSFEKANLAESSIAGFASIDIKSDEESLLSFVAQIGVPIRFYKAQELAKVSVPNPSNAVQSEVGTHSVAEAASVLAAGKNAILKVEKQIFKSDQEGAVTIAVAQSLEPFAPHRGELHLVGSGPGEMSFLTGDARHALSRTVVWVGYKLYLDLLEPFRRYDQVRVDSSLTFEKDRCQEAINLAMQGVKVSLISSGDSGIYGMAGLALDLLLKLPKQSRPSFEVHPGITALQVAAAKTGAPLMHDFCAISLSDCLTPWEKIEARLRAASEGDFVVAIYNPRSKERYWQLESALQIMLENRLVTTPVVLARQLGRTNESISIFALGDFPISKVDMLSVVVVGNSSTFEKDGHLITPRGY
ncbi:MULTISPECIES: precorrin-3B C(17)-methyltransferase [Prochlorococcus]|uniref:precorrin-3B C(17)-methyltransferase n=1 Tax=Prochlorococcus TaxID=1218 RepID=UPI00053375B2|nr:MULTISPECIES: precorrin-3B C(17)-methyltransferase [Prochlorococcus]KGG13545.1 Cobalamin biosynthesis protein CbiG [Prochlorococcus sp. MIT 0601]